LCTKSFHLQRLQFTLQTQTVCPSGRKIKSLRTESNTWRLVDLGQVITTGYSTRIWRKKYVAISDPGKIKKQLRLWTEHRRRFLFGDTDKWTILDGHEGVCSTYLKSVSAKNMCINGSPICVVRVY
jgi:hypothetical protein